MFPSGDEEFGSCHEQATAARTCTWSRLHYIVCLYCVGGGGAATDLDDVCRIELSACRQLCLKLDTAPLCVRWDDIEMELHIWDRIKP